MLQRPFGNLSKTVIKYVDLLAGRPTSSVAYGVADLQRTQVD